MALGHETSLVGFRGLIRNWNPARGPLHPQRHRESSDSSSLVASVPKYRGYMFRNCPSGRGRKIDGEQVYALNSVTCG